MATMSEAIARCFDGLSLSRIGPGHHALHNRGRRNTYTTPTPRRVNTSTPPYKEEKGRDLNVGKGKEKCLVEEPAIDREFTTRKGSENVNSGIMRSLFGSRHAFYSDYALAAKSTPFSFLLPHKHSMNSLTLIGL